MSLTFEDVRTVLAVLDGHAGGVTRFSQGDLSVVIQAGVESAAADLAPAPGRAVRAPAVGRFQPATVDPGTAMRDDTVIGIVQSVGREMTVTAGATGTLTGFAVKPGDFVEYGQLLATMSEGGTS